MCIFKNMFISRCLSDLYADPMLGLPLSLELPPQLKNNYKATEKMYASPQHGKRLPVKNILANVGLLNTKLWKAPLSRWKRKKCHYCPTC